jgi:hypothetical protein
MGDAERESSRLEAGILGKESCDLVRMGSALEIGARSLKTCARSVDVYDAFSHQSRQINGTKSISQCLESGRIDFGVIFFK